MIIDGKHVGHNLTHHVVEDYLTATHLVFGGHSAPMADARRIVIGDDRRQAHGPRPQPRSRAALALAAAQSGSSARGSAACHRRSHQPNEVVSFDMIVRDAVPIFGMYEANQMMDAYYERTIGEFGDVIGSKQVVSGHNLALDAASVSGRSSHPPHLEPKGGVAIADADQGTVLLPILVGRPAVLQEPVLQAVEHHDTVRIEGPPSLEIRLVDCAVVQFKDVGPPSLKRLLRPPDLPQERVAIFDLLLSGHHEPRTATAASLLVLIPFQASADFAGGVEGFEFGCFIIMAATLPDRPRRRPFSRLGTPISTFATAL